MSKSTPPFSKFTLAELQDLTRRLLWFAVRLLDGAGLAKDAPDVVQLAFERVLDGTRNWREGEDVRQVMYETVRSIAGHMPRSKDVKTFLIDSQIQSKDGLQEGVISITPADESLTNPELLLISSEESTEKAIALLAREDAELAKFVMLKLMGGSNRQIAKELNCTVNKIYALNRRVARAIDRQLLVPRSGE